MPPSQDPLRVAYDPAEHREKHCWNESRAEFVKVGTALVGKCPSTLTKEQAEALVNEAVWGSAEAGQSIRQEMPERVWNVHEGIVYEAVPTRDGAYHGYPWRGRPTRNRLPRAVKRVLEARAIEQGFERTFKDWLSQHDA
jgi:hypothetical protein